MREFVVIYHLFSGNVDRQEQASYLNPIVA